MAISPWTDVFTGGPLWPSSVSEIDYNLDTIGSSIVLQFPFVATTLFVTAGTIRVTTSNAAHTITMPSVNIVSPGYSFWVANVGSANLPILKSDGSSLLTLPPGTFWLLQVVDNTTLPGGWFTMQLGATTSSATASQLVGPGLTVYPLDTTRLATNIVSSIKTAPYTVQFTDRASTIIWKGGSDTILLPDYRTEPGFYVYISNQTTTSGLLTLSCVVSGQKINGLLSIIMVPGTAFGVQAGPDGYYALSTVFASGEFTFPDGTITNPSLNFFTDISSGISHSFSSTNTQRLNFSLNGSLQLSVQTNSGVSTSVFSNNVQIPFLNVGLGSFATPSITFDLNLADVHSGIYLDTSSDPSTPFIGFKVSYEGKTVPSMAVFEDFIDANQSEFLRDDISYAAWIRLMI